MSDTRSNKALAQDIQNRVQALNREFQEAGRRGLVIDLDHHDMFLLETIPVIRVRVSERLT